MQERHTDVLTILQELSERAQSPCLLSAGLAECCIFLPRRAGPVFGLLRGEAGQGYEVRVVGVDALERWSKNDIVF